MPMALIWGRVTYGGGVLERDALQRVAGADDVLQVGLVRQGGLGVRPILGLIAGQLPETRPLGPSLGHLGRPSRGTTTNAVPARL